MSAVPFIEAREMHAYYGASHILRGVSLKVMPGETLCILGRNGMGKTTTLRALLGLTPPSQGEVRVHGRDVTRLPPHRIVRMGIAYVPENRGIFPNLSVRENLLMPARPGADGRHEWTFDRVVGLFPRLAERLDNMGHHLSGGEQQMLTIGRALMTNPGLLILDEATEGLAPLIRKEIWSVIRAIKATGIAAIIVDKNVDVLMEICDSAVVMAKGEVVFAGTARVLAADAELRVKYLGV
ncbi:MAG: ABC transporter ATP-binding protein [Alphaproteobacteria bacterium]|nr:ABC transporter ATP-binding protein [Alphaproteobacteria bacterium]